jgi:hypothetical protein
MKLKQFKEELILLKQINSIQKNKEFLQQLHKSKLQNRKPKQL